MCVDRRRRPPAAPPCRRRSASRCRSSRRCRAGGSRWPPPPRRAPRARRAAQIAVDVDQGHRRRRRNPQLAAGECDDAAARLLEQIVPAGSCELVVGTGRLGRRRRRRRRGASSVTRASGRFHGSAPGIASRVTSIDSVAPSRHARQRRAAAGYSSPPLRPRPRCGRDRDQPGLEHASRRDRRRPARSAPRRSRRPRPAPRGSRRSRARSAIQASRVSRAIFSSTRVSASGRPTTLE